MKLCQELLDKITLNLDFEINVILNTNNIKKKYIPNAHTFNWAISCDNLDVLKWLEKNTGEVYTRYNLTISMKYNSNRCFSYLLTKENINITMDDLLQCSNKHQIKEIEKRLPQFDSDNQKNIMNSIAKRGDVELFKYCKKRGYFHDMKEIMHLAIVNKKLDFIKFLYSEGYSYPEPLRISDIDYDSILIFKFLYMHYPDVKIREPEYKCSQLDSFREIYGEKNIFFKSLHALF